jgi:hypothetical protein
MDTLERLIMGTTDRLKETKFGALEAKEAQERWKQKKLAHCLREMKSSRQLAVSKRASACNLSVLSLLTHFHLRVATASEGCMSAYSAFSSTEQTLCNSTGLSLDQLQAEACPSDCQALYDNVLSNCTVGDTYAGGLEFEKIALFNREGHKWTDCNLGYEPTLCERAFNFLDTIGNDYSTGPCNIDDLTADQLESDPCPQDCQIFYDEIVASCTEGDVYNGNLPTSSLFLYKDDQLFLSEGHKWAACDYGYNFTDCQRSFRILEEEDGPCIGFDSTEEEFATEACPEPCQDLFNGVIAKCEPNVAIQLTPSESFGISSIAVYKEAYLWSTYGQYKQCDYGYDPTLCDIAVRSLSEDATGVRSLVLGPNSTVCDSEDNENVCTAECIKLIDAVLLDCFVGAEFAPSAGYLSKTNERILFHGPQSLSSLGLDPTTSFLSSLSERCWDYYMERSPPQSAFDGMASSKNNTVAPTSSPIQPGVDAPIPSPSLVAGDEPTVSPILVDGDEPTASPILKPIASPILVNGDEPTTLPKLVGGVEPNMSPPLNGGTPTTSQTTSSVLTHGPRMLVSAYGWMSLTCMITTFYF